MFLNVGNKITCVVAVASQLAIMREECRCSTLAAMNGSAKALAAWLAIRGTDHGKLFVGINKGGRVGFAQAGMTAQSIYDMLVKRREQAGIGHFSPHDLRRSFVSDMLDAGAH
jgi:site-specific recombinase XerC